MKEAGAICKNEKESREVSAMKGADEEEESNQRARERRRRQTRGKGGGRGTDERKSEQAAAKVTEVGGE